MRAGPGPKPPEPHCATPERLHATFKPSPVERPRHGCGSGTARRGHRSIHRARGAIDTVAALALGRCSAPAPAVDGRCHRHGCGHSPGARNGTRNGAQSARWSASPVGQQSASTIIEGAHPARLDSAVLPRREGISVGVGPSGSAAAPGGHLRGCRPLGQTFLLRISGPADRGDVLGTIRYRSLEVSLAGSAPEFRRPLLTLRRDCHLAACRGDTPSGNTAIVRGWARRGPRRSP